MKAKTLCEVFAGENLAKAITEPLTGDIVSQYLRIGHNERTTQKLIVFMMLNLTQHLGTPDQGVTEPNDKEAVQRLLTFDTLPTVGEIRARARSLAEMARQSGATSAMVGGAPFLMSSLERELMAVGVRPEYAFSVRQSVETVGTDGKSVKTSVFNHVGFVEVPA